ncbi:hypothetical protein [Sphingorhabdus sp.]|uniref:hypothetical protein n=1 Tax=Sphingorhabdus sp. TaxID=1902408 RepID=UPI0038FC0842
MMRPARLCSARSAGVLCIQGDPASVNLQVAGSNPSGITIVMMVRHNDGPLSASPPITAP